MDAGDAMDGRIPLRGLSIVYLFRDTEELIRREIPDFVWPVGVVKNYIRVLHKAGLLCSAGQDQWFVAQSRAPQK
jgi:hypothetical protein